MNTSELDYEPSKNHAKKIYRSIGSIFVPALDNAEVTFSNMGFNHLIRKGRIPRTRKEQQKRFALIQYAESILNSPHITIIYRRKERSIIKNRKSGEQNGISTIQFWTFVKSGNDQKIKLVIIQFNKGKKQFLSIMVAKKTKKISS